MKYLINQLRIGYRYQQIWPLRPELSLYFPENRVILATQIAVRFMPICAMISTFMLINWFGTAFSPQAFAIGLFFVSLPLQGYIWLAKRAQTYLSPAMQRWFLSLMDKLQAVGEPLPRFDSLPTYMDLGCLLAKGYQRFDKARWYEFDEADMR